MRPARALWTRGGLPLPWLKRRWKTACSCACKAPVTAIGKTPGGFCVQTPRGAYEARYVFNAAGVQADEVHALLEAPGYAITPAAANIT